MNEWSPREIEILKDSDSAKLAKIKLDNEKYWRTYNSVSKKFRRLKKKGLPSTAEKFIKNKSVRETISQIESQLQEMIEDKKNRTIEIKPATSGLSLVLFLSDFHIGKKIVKQDEGEVYNTEIGIERLQKIPQLITDSIPELLQNRVDEVVVLLGGDLVDGEGIYPGQSEAIDCNIPQQVIAATEAVWYILTDLQDLFNCPVRVITARGNHGKTGLSPEANFDNILYQNLLLLSMMQKEDKKRLISISIQPGQFNQFEVQGWKGLLRHYAPMGTESSTSVKKFLGWKDIHNCDLVCYGHYHHWGINTLNNMLVVRNGSLTGGCEYGESLGVDDSPTQLLFGVTSDALPLFVKPLELSNV